jgi:hypothetical protein
MDRLTAMRRRRLRRSATAVVAGLCATMLLAPGTASAAVDDSFAARTTDRCGVANFIDYGPGAPGGGNNDDYIVLHDYCADGHGVRVHLYWNGLHWSSVYNGNGLAGDPVIWDPFRATSPNDVEAGDGLQLQVCLVDGPNDDTGARCGWADRISVDG